MEKNNSDWNKYFSDHYKSNFSRRDIAFAQNFLHGQLKFLNIISPILPGDHVLEIGCALGAFIETIKNRGVRNISAIELDEEAAQYVRNTLEVDVKNTPIADVVGECFYDKIYAFEVLEHLNNPLDDLDRIYALLKPGGCFIGSTPYPFRRNIVSDKTHLFVLHPDNWARLFKKVGFEIKMMRPATGLPYLYRFSKLFSIYFRFYVPFFPLVSTTLFVVRKPLVK